MSNEAIFICDSKHDNKGYEDQPPKECRVTVAGGKKCEAKIQPRATKVFQELQRRPEESAGAI